MKSNFGSALLLALVLGACDLGSEPEILPLSVSASIEAAPGEPEGLAALVYEITNDGTAALWVGGCDGEPLVSVERREDGEWEDVSAGVCQANVEMTPIEIAAGETLEGTRLIDDVPGSYRAIAWGFRYQHHAAVPVISNTVSID